MLFLKELRALVWRCTLTTLLGLASQVQAQTQPQTPAPITSATIAEVGHSLVNTTMPAMFVQVAQSLQKQIQLTAQIINGAPLSWQWNNHTQAQRSAGNPAFADLHAAIPTLRPDVLVLTERVDIASTIRWENTNGYVAMWLARARSANPNVRPYLYSTWFGWGNSQWYPGTPTRAVWRTRIEADGLLYEQVATTAGMQIVPGHRAMMALYDAVMAGEVPGITSINAFFTDDIHLNGMGNYYIALVHYATLYKASPVGAAVPANAGVGAALALQLQQMAWSVVSGYRLSGVTPAAPGDGACGPANGGVFSAPPLVSLCSTGTPSAVTGTGPYAWTCAGTDGGTTASCSATRPAPVPINGTCGTANGQAAQTAPAAGLCAAGTSSAVMGSGPFAWSCAGLNGGTAAGCSAPLLVTPPPLPPVAGSCGAANGGTFAEPPSANLCQSGTATAVTGAGPFAWSCTGSNGGASSTCQANRSTTGGAPSVTTNTIGSLPRGASRFFTVSVPAGARRVSFVLTGTAGDSDLYVSLGSQRPRNTAQWRSTSWSPNDQVNLNQPTAGTYYVEVYGYATTTGVVLRTTVTP